MTPPRCLLALAFVLVVPSHAEDVAVFLAAGQSNATPPWAEGIGQVLRESGRYPRVQVVHSVHVGNPLYQWFDGGRPAANYGRDLAKLREAIDAIQAAGDTPVFRGFFWMQGEGDCKWDIYVELYRSRFNGMMEQYRTDLNLADAPRFALGITDANPDPKYDDPAVLLTTRERVEALRAQQILIGAQANGVAVDSRGLTRVDALHIEWTQSGLLGKQMAAAWLAKFPEPTAYTAWASSKGLEGANNAPDHDLGDSDGIPNILEFVLNGNPLASDAGKLPVQSQDDTHFYFDFDRRDDSVSETALTFNYGSLVPDLPFSVAIPSDKTPAAGPPVTITDNGDGTHHVKITVPRSGNSQLFGRLQAE